MEIERCSVCGWPAPKGRPCPRGCASVRPASPPPAPVSVVAPAAVAASAIAAPVAAPVMVAQTPPPEVVASPAPGIRPDSRTAQRLAGPRGLGGYLLLPIIGLFATIFWNARYLIQTLIPLYRSSGWAALTTPGNPQYHWLWQPLILFETFGAVVMAIAPIALLIMIFRKRRAARRYVIAFYAFACVVGAVDAGACLLVMVDWLRSIGLTEAASALSTDAVQTLLSVFVLAAIWIPYFVRSRRVKNTLNNPALPGQVDPAHFMAAGDAKPAGRRRALSATIAIVGIIIVAGAAVFTLNTFETSSVAQSSAAPASQATQFSQDAEAAFAAGNLGQAVGLYTQAIQADRGYETAYHGEWNALVAQNNYAVALELATETTRQFPTSRLAWFELGFAQEAQGELAAAAQSYTTCLQHPQDSAPGAALASDALVHKRLDLVTYVTAITGPREAIAGAVAEVNTALDATTANATSLSSAATQVATVMTTNIDLLQKVTPPAYFADFHSGMLAAYGNIKSACDALATAAAGGEAASLSSAKQSLNGAVDRFNENDKLGTSLLQSYYSQ
jgi:tetratricopeptide (TPR) repeat protein